MNPAFFFSPYFPPVTRVFEVFLAGGLSPGRFLFLFSFFAA